MRWMYFVKRSWKFDKQNVGSLLGIALLIILLPLRWFAAAIIAALLHELGHYCAVRLTGGTIHRLKVGLSGAVMETSGLSGKSELICLLAGPLAGLLPLLAIRIFPTLALCGVIQSLYNLLPVYPLDGGKMLHRIILIFGGTDRCFRFIEYSVLLLMLFLCIYIRLRFGISLFLFLAVFLFRKTPCKPQKDWI